MRTAASTRQAGQAEDLASAPQSLTWLVYCRDNKLLTASEWALAALLVTLGQGQNITLSVTGMADITGMDRKTVRKAIDSLEAKGLMVFVRPGRNQTKVYRLALPRWGNGTHPGEEMAPTQVRNPHPPGEEMAPTTSRQDQDLQQDLTSTSDDDVSSTAAPSGKNRAKDDVPAIEVPSVDECVSDLEGCRDELARRLGVEPGRITVKPLAKKLRNLVIKHDTDELWSDILDIFPEDDTMWRMPAGKDNPPGFLLFALEQFLEGHDLRASYRRPYEPEPEPEVEVKTEPVKSPRDEAIDLIKEYAALTGQAPGDIEADLRSAHLGLHKGISMLRWWIAKTRAEQNSITNRA